MQKVLHFTWHAVKHTALHVIIPNVLRFIVVPAVCLLLAVFGIHVDATSAVEHLMGETGAAAESCAHAFRLI